MSNFQEKMKQKIANNYKSREKKSLIEYNQIFNYPEDVKFFKPHTDKINKIIILPYKVKSTNDAKTDQGGDAYIFEYFVHRSIGINRESVLCLFKTYGKPCPICEEIKSLADDYEKNKDIIRGLKATHRGVYNVLDLLDEKPNEVKIFNSSFAFFESEMLEEVMDPETGEYICFPDTTENGYIIRFRATEEEFGKVKYNKFKAFRFEKRGKAVDPKTLAETLSSDEFLNIPTYEEVKSIFLGESSEASEEAEPKNNPSPNKDYYNEVVDPKPKKEEKNKCPHGHTFGKDVDTHDDCIQCSEWEKCSAEES